VPYLPAAAVWRVLDQRIAIRYERKPFKAAGTVVVLLAAAAAVGSNTLLSERFAVVARGVSEMAGTPFAASPARGDRRLPAGTSLSVLVESYPDSETSEAAVRELTAWLEASGFHVFHERVDLGAEGRQWRVLAGTYTEHEYEAVSWDAARLKVVAPVLQARVIATAPARRRK
jgi:hypothetical protein